MTATFDDYDKAIRAFWAARTAQTQKQVATGKVDAGTRGSVTGGLHLAGLQNLIASQFEPLAEMGAQIRQHGAVPLPGFFRRAKNWDIVVTYNGALVAAIECKSQVGSFGNNVNNRTEEAVGNAVDLWRAHEAGLTGGPRPWLGFVFVLEHAPESTSMVRNRDIPLYLPDIEFESSSYTRRYQILLERLVRERLYDAACLISTVKGDGIYAEPVSEISTRNLTAAIARRVAYIQGL